MDVWKGDIHAPAAKSQFVLVNQKFCCFNPYGWWLSGYDYDSMILESGEIPILDTLFNFSFLVLKCFKSPVGCPLEVPSSHRHRGILRLRCANAQPLVQREQFEGGPTACVRRGHELSWRVAGWGEIPDTKGRCWRCLETKLPLNSGVN